jgi:hypothetical protein
MFIGIEVWLQRIQNPAGLLKLFFNSDESLFLQQGKASCDIVN